MNKFLYSQSNYPLIRPSPRSFTRELLQKMIRVELLDLSSAVEIDPLISNDGHPRLQDEAQDAGFDFEVSAIEFAHVLICS